MKIDWANLTTSTVTRSEIGTMLVNSRTHVKNTLRKTPM